MLTMDFNSLNAKLATDETSLEKVLSRVEIQNQSFIT